MSNVVERLQEHKTFRFGDAAVLVAVDVKADGTLQGVLALAATWGRVYCEEVHALIEKDKPS